MNTPDKLQYIHFIQNIHSYEDAQGFLRRVRHTPIGKYPLTTSRKLWMAFAIYKFRTDVDANEVVWANARNVVIGLIRGNCPSSHVETYLATFEEWKRGDYANFVADIASFYYNLMEIKRSIEDTRNPETTREWSPHYVALITKIRRSCEAIGCLEAVERFMERMELEKYSAVAGVMRRAYWDKIEEDIRNEDFTLLLQNVEEMVSYMGDILPMRESREEMDDVLSVAYIQQRIQTKTFDNEYLVSLFEYIVRFARQWDSVAAEAQYDAIRRTVLELIEGSYAENPCHVIRTTFETAMEIVMKLRTVVKVMRSCEHV